MLTVICEAEGSAVSEQSGGGTVLCARADMLIYGSPVCIYVTRKTHKKTIKKTVKHRAEPTEIACRAHFQMHEPHYVMLWHRLTRENM